MAVLQNFRGSRRAVCPAVNLAAGADALQGAGPTGYTNIIFCCSYSGGFAARLGCFPKRLTPRVSGELRACEIFRPIGHYCFTIAVSTGADDYYDRALPRPMLWTGSRVPTLVIHAANDPFHNAFFLETRQKISFQSINILYIETDDGGHCAFVGDREGLSTYDGRWAERGSRGVRQTISVACVARAVLPALPACTTVRRQSACATHLAGAERTAKPSQNLSPVSLETLLQQRG